MERQAPLHLRVFLSSPGDVEEERRIACQVLDQLPKRPHARGKVTIEVIAWDDPDAPAPLAASETPQVSVNQLKGLPADCDLTVVILWGKIGTPPYDLVRPDGSRYESGTVWEYEDALQSQKDVLIYRRTEKPRIDIDDPEIEAKRQQYQAVNKFFERFNNADGSLKGGINPYGAPEDFRETFEKHLESLIRARLDAQEVGGGPDTRRATASLSAGPMWTWPKPWDFSGYVNEKRRAFVGREWWFEKVETWIKSDRSQALLLLADYGVGKSAFLADLVQRNPGQRVAAHHFCHHDTAETLNPATFVRSLAAHLARTLPDYKTYVENDTAVREWLDKADTDPGSAFERAIVGPLAHVPEPAGGATCIIIDALDESLEFDAGKGRKLGSHIVGLLASRASRLPAWIKVLASSRRRREVLQKIQQSFRTQIIDGEDAHNLEDIRRYVIQRCQAGPLAEKLMAARKSSEWVASILADRKRSGGKFLYVGRVLKDVGAGVLDVERLGELPPGMDGFYADAFERRFGANDADYAAIRPVLGLLAAARESLLRTDLAQILDQHEDKVRDALAQVEDFLTIRDKRYAFDHYSLAQWLTEENDQGFPRAGSFAVSLFDAQQRFNMWALKQVQAGCAHESVYLARHLPAHLGAEDRADAYCKLLLDYQWLDVRLREAGINALLNDWPADSKESPITAVYQALRQAAHILGYEGADWTGADQLAPQLLARLQYRSEPEISALLANACAIEQRKAQPWARPLTASLFTSSALDRILECHQFGVDALTVLPDGRLASAGLRGIKIWNIDTGRCELTIEDIDNSRQDALVALTDGRLVSNYGKNIKIWSAITGECEVVLEGHEDAVMALVVLSDGRLASLGRDETIRIWNLGTCECEAAIDIDAHEDLVVTMTVLPGGRLASGSWDKTIRIWSLTTGRCEAKLEGNDKIRALAVLPEDRLASAEGHSIRIWNSNKNSDVILAGHTSLISALAVLPDGRLVSAAWDNTVRIWNTITGQCQATLEGHSDYIEALIAIPGGRIASGGWDHTIRLWKTNFEQREAIVEEHAGSIRSLVVLSEPRLVSVSDDSTIKIWEMPTGRCQATIHIEVSYLDNNALVALSDGRLALNDRSIIEIWNPATGQRETTFEGHTDRVTALAQLPSETLISASADKTIRLWNIGTGRCDGVLEVHGYIWSVAVLLDGRLASGDSDGAIKVWNLDSGQCEITMEDSRRGVRALGSLPDGLLASASRAIRLWNIRNGEALCTLGEEDSGSVTDLVTLPGGQIISASGNLIYYWLPRSRVQPWRKLTIFAADATISHLAYASNEGILAAGDTAGCVHFLKLENMDVKRET